MSILRKRDPPQGIGAGAIPYGTLAARPAFGTINTYYWATDIFTLFRDTGAAWEVVGAQFYILYQHNILAQIFGTNDTAILADTVYLLPVQIPRTVTADLIYIFNGNINAGGRLVGIYEDNGETPVGGALLVESAGVATTGVNRRQEIDITDIQLTLGLYWLAVLFDDAADRMLVTPTEVCRGGTLQTYSYALAYPGPLTDPCPAVVDRDPCPIIGVKLASIP